MRLLWLALLASPTLSAAELTPSECRALGVQVDNSRPATGQVIGQTNSSTEQCGTCHSAAMRGEAAWVDYNQYAIRYASETARKYAVCRAEYEVQFTVPPSKPVKPGR